MIQDVDLAGNFYAARARQPPQAAAPRLGDDHHRLEHAPDAEAWDLDAEVLGYAYHPGGPSRRDPVACCRTRSRTSRRSPTRPPTTAACRG
jgi:hypothetical protein